jgi:hypothetical protein
MSDVGRTRCRRSHGLLLVATALLSATLLACGGAAPVEVTASGLPPAPPPPASEPATRFQGSVVAVDVGAGVLVVDVTIVWTPVIAAGGDQRRVVVGAGTRWDRGVSLAGLRAGEEVQVDASDPVDGSWPALRVQVFDID